MVQSKGRGDSRISCGLCVYDFSWTWMNFLLHHVSSIDIYSPARWCFSDLQISADRSDHDFWGRPWRRPARSKAISDRTDRLGILSPVFLPLTNSSVWWGDRTPNAAWSWDPRCMYLVCNAMVTCWVWLLYLIVRIWSLVILSAYALQSQLIL
jgi:hypothetical protein